MLRGTGSARLGLERRADGVPTAELGQSRTRYKYGLNHKLKKHRKDKYFNLKEFYQPRHVTGAMIATLSSISVNRTNIIIIISHYVHFAFDHHDPKTS